LPSAPHILIAHAHNMVRALLPQLIARIYPPATVTVVTNGPDALEAYRQSGADLVIINQRMAGMRGTDLIRALRAHQATCPILLISSDEAAEATILQMGATRFLRAPFGLEDFRQALTSLLPL
jgi:two-component system, OmpR family, response regulator RegX3